MPEAAVPPAPAVETPPIAPITPEVKPETGAPPTPPRMMMPEDDPNHQMQMLLEKRKTRKAAEEAKTPEKPAEKPPEKAEEKPAEEKPRLNDLIAKALKFTPKKEEKKDETRDKAQEKPAEVAKVKAGDNEDAGKGTASDKTIVKPKKAAEVPAFDLGKVVSEAVTATARAMQPVVKPEVAPPTRLEDALKEDDRQEYIVAKYLSDTNPKFKGAEKVVLDHIKKSEDYASRWETANPGKLFNPNDEEHDDFYSALTKPWSDRDFRDAEIEMKAEQIVERKLKGSQAKMDRLEQDSARVELAPVVQQRFNSAAVELAKAVGQDIHEKISRDGFAKLEQEDPITAQVLTETLGPLQPIIETIIQIDDVKGRFAIDPKNPLHQQWNEILVGGEKQCAGMKDEQGRAFATRSEYAQMNSTQRKNHWYLTPEHLISGIIDYAAKTASSVIKSEKERMKKMAEALGYVPKPAVNGNGSGTGATKGDEKMVPEKQPETVVKPVSPSVGSGAKIDDKGEKPKTGNAALMDAFTKTLFSRG
jgi:hypothetical protein